MTSGLNHISRMKPGIASCFAPKSGTHQECTTSAAGQGKDGKYACDYPTDHLMKAISAKLETKNPGAFDFLKKMKWSDNDQNTVTEYKNADNMTIDQAAQKWVDANPTVWQAWLK